MKTPNQPKNGKKLPQPKGAPDPGPKMGEIARQAANISRKEMQDHAAATKSQKEDPRPTPIANARKWLERIRRSEKIRRPFREDGERYMRMYQGDYSFKPSKKRNVDAMSINLVYAHIETSTPAIFSGFPFIKVRPKPKVGLNVADQEAKARAMELVINYWFKELAVDLELHDVLFDSFFGLAGVDMGWETDVRVTEEIATTEDEAEVEEPAVTAVVDRPFIKRLPSSNIYLDPDARRRRDCRWMATEEVITWNDFLASSLYTDSAKKKVKPQFYPKNEDEKNWLGRDEDRSDKTWVQLFTIWDKDTKRKFIVATGYEGLVNTDDPMGEPWPYEMEYHGDPYPICILDAKRDHLSPYSWSEFKAVEPQIQELNRLRAAIQIHVKRTLPKYIYTEDVGTKGDVAKLMNARSDEAVKLDSLVAIKPLETAPVPPELWKFAEMARDDYTNTIGEQELQQEALAKTATEASIVQGNTNIRQGMRSKMWEQYVVEIAAKLAQLCQQNMDEKIAIEIAGPAGIKWLEVDKTQIQGEFWYDMEPGIMEYKNEAMRNQQLLKFYEIAQTNPLVNVKFLTGKVAQDIFDMDPMEVTQPPNPPPPPPPELKFKEIDLLAVQDPQLQNILVLTAAKQCGVQLPPDLISRFSQIPAPTPPPGAPGQMPPHPPGIPPGPPPGSPPVGGGKDIAGTGMNPNGNPGLPPVAGNLHPGGLSQ